jgi:hypothetical protein
MLLDGMGENSIEEKLVINQLHTIESPSRPVATPGFTVDLLDLWWKGKEKRPFW